LRSSLTSTSGTTGVAGCPPKRRPGIERADFGNHLAQVLVVDAAQALQRGEVAPRQELEIVEQRRYRRIEAVALLELEGEALGQRARGHAGGIERLKHAEHALDARPLDAEAFGDFREIAGEIARLVDEIDQVGGDKAIAGIDDGQGHLLDEMIAQGRLARQRPLEARLSIVEVAARPPVGEGFAVAAGLAAGAAAVIPHLGRFGVERSLSGIGQVVGLGERGAVGSVVGVTGGIGAGAIAFAQPVLALEKRILRELLFDVGGELEIRELQQADGLLQLRRHDERRRLPQSEFGGERHGPRG
jgi:hypothetical protein